MPTAMAPTMAEREAELAALQSAFDEYIASSRELEEELDAELAKMQEKLADSSAANAALSAQLENIAPQLAALEKALSESRSKLKEEQKLRRQAEQAQDELEAKYREAEGSLIAVKEECDAVHEELAFKESELEETRLELEIERERHRVELEDALAGAITPASGTVNTDEATRGEAAASSSVDEAYVKKLEDELELVTEQLIETEARLSQTEDKLSILESKNSDNDMDKLLSDVDAVESAKDKELIRVLQEENAQRLEEEHKLREELELTKEELALTQEELKAVEFDAKEITEKMDQIRAEHREEINNLRSMLQNTESNAKTTGAEVEAFSKTLGAAAEETAALKDEIDSLNYALENAKRDHEATLEELEAVNQRFDEAMTEAEKRGREYAGVEMRSQMQQDRDTELDDLKQQLAMLAKENAELQNKVDDAEMSLAVAKDSQARNVEGVEVQSELVKQLQAQLKRSKEDLSKKEAEMGVLVSKMEERVTKAEENVTRLENELSITKGKLAEAEASLIVSKRERELAESKDLRKSMSKSMSKRSVASRSTIGTSTIFNPELDNMEKVTKVSRRRRIRSNSPNSFKRLELRLGEEKNKMKELQKEHDKLKEQKRMGENHLKRLEEDLKVLQRQLFSSGETGVSTQMSRLSSLASGAGGGDILNDDGVSKIEEIIAKGDPALMKEELRTLDKKCNAQRYYNNQLLSKMLSLQGNIQVFCRIRPMSFKIHKGCKAVVESLSETELGCFDSRTNQWKSFAFDRVWGPDQSQQSVFQDVEPIALSVVDGFNACIFSYGQTGSGKTFTMEGVERDNQRGISYRTIQKVFHLLKVKQQQEKTAAILLKTQEEREEEPKEFKFEIMIGMLEIYNDECYDLLESTGSSLEQKKRDAVAHGGKASLEIRRSKEGRIEVPNLTKEPVSCIEDVISLLKKGNSNRATAATSMNEHSSRSHMVLWVDVHSGLEGQPGNKGTLFLVDLAGSERVKKSEVEGDHLREAGHINKSLSALGNVMEALDRKASHVPYRDSKLTFLLQDSLGGNSRTMMVVAINPIDMSYDESIHALQFATRVRRINIGAAQRNVTSKNLEETIKELTAEMKKLTMQKNKTDSQLNNLKKDNARIQDKLSKLSDARKTDKSDNKTLEVLRKNNNEMARRWEKEKALREETTEELEKLRQELRKSQQQVTRYEREKETLEQKLDEKEKILEKKSTELRTAKEASSAANIRARKAQVLGARATPRPTPMPTPTKTPASTAKSVSSRSAASVSTSGSGSTVTSEATSTLASEDVSEIRGKVLELLEKYDKAKVNRIDIIMEKFKGKEALLLEKMTQRYEGGDESADGNAADDAKTRSQLAAERHMERMRKLREAKGK
jgi:chromosome segregation ATPase